MSDVDQRDQAPAEPAASEPPALSDAERAEPAASEPPALSDAERAERLAALTGLIDLMRPSVQADGGDLVLVHADVVAGVVEVQLQGACSSLRHQQRHPAGRRRAHRAGPAALGHRGGRRGRRVDGPLRERGPGPGRVRSRALARRGVVRLGAPGVVSPGPSGGEPPAPSAQPALAVGLGSLGRPSTRSPTMLRWIWAVPPQMVSEREKKNDACRASTG